VQKEDLKVLVDQTQLQRLGKEFCLVRMANQAKGQAGGFAFLASGRLFSTLQKQFSICVIFIWNKSLFFIAIIEQLPMPSKLCWSQNHPSSLYCSLVHAGHAAPRRVLSSWFFFWWFQNLIVDERRSAFYKTLLSLAFLKGLECWLIMSHLNELLQVTTRSSAPSNLVTFPRQMRVVRSSSFHKNVPTAVKHFWILLIVDWACVSFGWTFFQVTIRCSAVSNSVTFSRQMRDVSSSSLHKKSRQLSSTFCILLIDWWLIMFYLNEPLQFTTRSSAASNSVTFSRQMRGACSSSIKKPPTAVKHIWISLADDWACLIWMSFYKLQPGLQL